MALPAVACHYLFYAPVRNGKESWVFAAGFAAGATAILLSALLTATALVLAGKSYEMIGRMFLVANLPLAVIEGLVTGSVVVLVRKVRPEVLDTLLLEPLGPEVLDA
jgi:cobalt/nickel transport system permease protein